jgi:hypothetical protein
VFYFVFVFLFFLFFFSRFQPNDSSNSHMFVFNITHILCSRTVSSFEALAGGLVRFQCLCGAACGSVADLSMSISAASGADRAQACGCTVPGGGRWADGAPCRSPVPCAALFATVAPLYSLGGPPGLVWRPCSTREVPGRVTEASEPMSPGPENAAWSIYRCKTCRFPTYAAASRTAGGAGAARGRTASAAVVTSIRPAAGQRFQDRRPYYFWSAQAGALL